MALPPPTTLAWIASVVVALLAASMAVLTARSYATTGNPRLLFVLLAFALYAVKSLFVAYTVVTHLILHDTIEFFSALFDVGIVVLFFVPFVMSSAR